VVVDWVFFMAGTKVQVLRGAQLPPGMAIALEVVLGMEMDGLANDTVMLEELPTPTFAEESKADPVAICARSIVTSTVTSCTFSGFRSRW
jgi:hypothetical protein